MSVESRRWVENAAKVLRGAAGRDFAGRAAERGTGERVPRVRRLPRMGGLFAVRRGGWVLLITPHRETRMTRRSMSTSTPMAFKKLRPGIDQEGIGTGQSAGGGRGRPTIGEGLSSPRYRASLDQAKAA